MKKIIFMLVILIAGCGSAEVEKETPKEFPIEEGRFDFTEGVIGRNIDIVTDKKTGCQYLYRYNGGMVSLGCFPEYISPKFKK